SARARSDATSRGISPAYRKPDTCWQHHAAFNRGVTYSESARTAPRRIRMFRMRVAVLLVVLAAIAAALGHRLPGSSLSPASSPSRAARPIDVGGVRRRHHGALGEAGGRVPAGTTVFDDEVPGVAKLDPALLGALRQAATD